MNFHYLKLPLHNKPFTVLDDVDPEPPVLEPQMDAAAATAPPMDDAN